MYYLWILARETPRTYERTFWSQIFICTVSVFSPWQLAPELGVSKKNPRAQCDCNVNSLRVILYNRVIDHKIPVFYTKEEKKKQAHINLLHPVCWAFCKENRKPNSKCRQTMDHTSGQWRRTFSFRERFTLQSWSAATQLHSPCSFVLVMEKWFSTKAQRSVLFQFVVHRFQVFPVNKHFLIASVLLPNIPRQRDKIKIKIYAFTLHVTKKP